MLGKVRDGISAFFAWSLGWIPRCCRAALGLSGEQRQTLMSWGLLGGVIALTGLKFWSTRVMESRWRSGLSPEIEKLLVEGLFQQLTWDTLLQGVLVAGVVAIARGGSMSMAVDRGGLKVDFQASGQAAKQLATDTSLADAMQAPPPPDAPTTPEEKKP